MAEWLNENIFITSKGNTAIANAALGKSIITITKVVSSSGFYAGDYPASATDLVKKVQNFVSVDWRKVANNSSAYLLQAQLSNKQGVDYPDAPSDRYTLCQIGVFARITDKDTGDFVGNEFLLMYAQPTKGTEDTISFTTDTEVLFTYAIQLELFSELDGKVEVEMSLDSVGFATEKYVQEVSGEIDTRKLERIFVPELPSSTLEYTFDTETAFKAVERCNLSISNKYLTVTTASNAGNKYALAQLNFASIATNAKTFVIEMDTRIPGARWYISLVDLSKRPGSSLGMTYDTTGVAFMHGTKDGSNYHVNGKNVMNSGFANTWLHTKTIVDMTNKKIKYEIADRDTGTVLSSNTVDFKDSETDAITGIELYSYTQTTIDVDNVKITAGYEIKENVLYMIGTNGIYDTYIYRDGEPILISSQTAWDGKADKTDIEKMTKVYTATCSTPANTATKVVTTKNGDFKLEDGAIVNVVMEDELLPLSGGCKFNIDGTGDISFYPNGMDGYVSGNYDGKWIYFTTNSLISLMCVTYEDHYVFRLNEPVAPLEFINFFYDDTRYMTTREIADAIDSKADEQTVGGGFAAGTGTFTGTDTSGVVIGANAKNSGAGGVAVGSGAEITGDGGAVGRGANTRSGAAVGVRAESNNGAALGMNSYSGYGAAVGNGAKTSSGAALGYNAKTVNASGTAIDAIQLGTGTNNIEKTLQVYDYQLMDATGNVPKERILTALENATDLQEISDVDIHSVVKTGIYQIGNNCTNLPTGFSGTGGATLVVSSKMVAEGGTTNRYVNQYIIDTYAGVLSSDDKTTIYACELCNTLIDVPWHIVGCNANIKKNPSATDGDIIDTHLTVGARESGGEIGLHSFTSGDDHTASGQYGVCVGGNGNTAEGNFSANIGGDLNYAAGDFSVVIGGNDNKALAYQIKAGHYAKDGTAGTSSGTTGDALAVGNGTNTAKSNCFRVAYNGNVYGMAAFNSTGADYAEYFEWVDGNPDNKDRRGLFVTLVEDKIKIAEEGDEIIGVISAAPSVIGNAYDDQWQGMYLTDVFGQPLTHMVHHEAEYAEVEVPDIDEDGNKLETTHAKQILVHEAYDAEEYIINPDYDSELEYIPRSQRKEWATVGMFGQLIVVDDGSCNVNGYCTVGNGGIATAAESGYRVLKRLDENHIKILFK